MNCSEFNDLIDLYIDEEMDESQRKAFEGHAAGCAECYAKLAAAGQLREILSQMDEEIDVPLPAQAAWRKAVREEARRKRMKRLYSVCGAVAAVCVLTVGITAMLRSGVRESLPQSGALVETDGLSENASLTGEAALMSLDISQAESYVERAICAEDVQETCDYLRDIVAEYNGTVVREVQGEGAVKVFAEIPGENAEDFVSAVDGLDMNESESAVELDANAASVLFCITISEN